MMHRPWRHDAFATQIWCCSFHSQWCDVCRKTLGEADIISVSGIISETTSFAEGKHHSKNAPLSTKTKVRFLLGWEMGFWTLALQGGAATVPGVVCAGKAYAFLHPRYKKAAWLLLTHRPLEKTTAIRKDDGCFLPKSNQRSQNRGKSK